MAILLITEVKLVLHIIILTILRSINLNYSYEITKTFKICSKFQFVQQGSIIKMLSYSKTKKFNLIT